MGKLMRSNPTIYPEARAGFTVAISALAGASVWALSPVLAGQPEPWDADGYFYIVALAISGAIAGWLAPRPLWAHYIGALIGQLCYEAVFLPVGPLLVLGAGFLLAYSLVFLAAAALAARARLSAAGATS